MNEELETVAVFTNSVDANLARQRLEAAGIRGFLDGEHTTELWRLPNALGGVKLQVAGSDAAAAHHLLESEPDGPYELDDHFGPDVTETDDFGPSGQQAEAGDDAIEPLTGLTPREENANRALWAALLGLLFPPLQLYVTWVLGKVFLSGDPWSPRHRCKALAALVLNVFVLTIVVLWYSAGIVE